MVGDANRRGYRHILDAFWDECSSHGVPLPTNEPVTAGAFCQARDKISGRLIQHLLREASSKFNAEFEDCSSWHGRRAYAVDGSKFNLGRSRELASHFGRPKGAHISQALVSSLVNVASTLPHDVRIAPYASCERALLAEHLEVLEPGDIVVLDRGYPSRDVFRDLMACQVDFLARAPNSSTFKAIEAFRQSGEIDSPITVCTPKGVKAMDPIELRAIRLRNGDGEESFYVTSLPLSDFSHADLAELYRLRWQAEELYRTQKASYFDQHQFHARSVAGVEQENFAQGLFVVIARVLMATAARSAEEYGALSIKSGILGLAAYVTRICLDDPESAASWMPRLLAWIARTRDKPRPGRSFPRKSFKPASKWRPGGHRGA